MAVINIEKAILGSKGNWTTLKTLWNADHGLSDPMSDDMAKQMSKLYSGVNKTGSLNSSSTGGGGGSDYGPAGGGGNFIQKLVESQMKEKKGEAGEFGTLEKSFGAFFDSEGKFRGIKGMIGEMANLLENEILIYLTQQAKLQSKINEETGMTGELSKAFRTEIMKASPEVIRLGISFEELTEAVTTVVKESGKFKLLSSDTIKEMALASKFTESMTTFAGMGKNFETIGIGIKNMASIVERMGKSSLEIGLNARSTTKLVDENLSKINQYGFKNGVAGLNEMAQKSLEFRMNMNSAFTLADQVWSPEGALKVVSELQVIGGAFGDLNDPIKLMYMATNNVEGLQDALIGASKSLVTFNDEQGRFEVTGANLRRAKEMADQFGISMQELTTGAIAAMERTSAASDLMATGLKMDDKDREFLTNLSQMKEGRMVIEVPESLQASLGKQTEIALDSMTSEQAKLLLDQREAFKKLSMEDIARQQVTAVENIERDVSFLRAVARVGVGQEVGDAIDKMIGVNQKMISDQSKGFTDKIAAGMSSGIESLSTKAKQLVGGNGPLIGQRGELATQAVTPNMKTNEKGTQTSNTTNTAMAPEEKNININVKSSSALVDGISRSIWSDPRFLQDIKRSYLSPN